MDEKTNAVAEAYWPPEGKQQLLQIPEGSPQVCTLRTGQTDVLQHHISTTSQVLIKQWPYNLSPIKQLALEEMLREGIVDPSHFGWALPEVLVPKNCPQQEKQQHKKTPQNLSCWVLDPLHPLYS